MTEYYLLTKNFSLFTQVEGLRSEVHFVSFATFAQVVLEEFELSLMLLFKLKFKKLGFIFEVWHDYVVPLVY